MDKIIGKRCVVAITPGLFPDTSEATVVHEENVRGGLGDSENKFLIVSLDATPGLWAYGLVTGDAADIDKASEDLTQKRFAHFIPLCGGITDNKSTVLASTAQMMRKLADQMEVMAEQADEALIAGHSEARSNGK